MRQLTRVLIVVDFIKQRGVCLNRRKYFPSWLLLLLILATPISHAKPEIYLFLGKEPAASYKVLLQNPNIKGAQIIYYWKDLEPKENTYNFSAINTDLQLLQSIHKKLFIQVQDRSFDPKIIPVPDYLLSKKYNGGIAKQIDFSGEGKPLSTGWVTKQWIPNVQYRFQKLLLALGKQFDGKIKGINLPETAIDIQEKENQFSCGDYFDSITANLQVLHSVFKKSDIVQYVNFFPCEWNNERHYMSRLFSFARENNIGLGGPDVIPSRHSQMQNSYPFFNHNKKKLSLVAFAVQEPDYTYTDPSTGKPFTVKQLYDFADTYLGANILFWNLQQPQYTQELIPFLSAS